MFSSKQYLKSTVLEYYWASSKQVSISAFGPYDISYILNKDGLKLYNDMLYNIKHKIYNNTITDYYILKSHSGEWYKNESSIFSSVKHPPYEKDTYNNIKIQGYTNNKETYITTSNVLFKLDDWVYTTNGSLYKLEGKCLGIHKQEK